MCGRPGDGAGRRNRACPVVPDPAAVNAVRVHRHPWPPLGGRPRRAHVRRVLAGAARLDRRARSSSRHTTRRSTVVCSRRVALATASGRRRRRSPAPSSLHAPSGASTRHGYPMSAGGSASLCVITTPRPTPKRARISSLRPSEKDGVADDTRGGSGADRQEDWR